MDEKNHALPPEGQAEPAQNTSAPLPFAYSITLRERICLPVCLCFCVLLVDAFFWHGPTAELGAAVFAWSALLLAYLGRQAHRRPEDWALLLCNLALAASLAVGSNWYFRLWNLLALVILLPVHAVGLSGAPRLPWHRPAMIGERLCLLLWGLFGRCGASAAVIARGRRSKHTAAVILGGIGAVVLVSILVPILSSADALFAAATEDVRRFVAQHLSQGLAKGAMGLIFTPFFFGLLYSLRHPIALTDKPPHLRRHTDAVIFSIILCALGALYLVFLGVQAAGLAGGAEYLAQRGISYAQWARSGFFQMVGVTGVNLAVLLTAVTVSRPEGRGGTVVRILASLVTVQSLLLLLCAAWRMTLYVGAYGLSFKRCMTYWGMVMMAFFLIAALVKCWRPAFSFFRAAFPAALAGWLVINCVPVDYLVAKNQVDRYLEGESSTVSIHYLAYSLSYDTLSELSRLDENQTLASFEGDWWSPGETLGELLDERRADARAECADWRTWSLSAFLASREPGAEE